MNAAQEALAAQLRSVKARKARAATVKPSIPTATKPQTPLRPSPSANNDRGLNYARMRQEAQDRDSSDFFSFPNGDTTLIIVMSAPEHSSLFYQRTLTHFLHNDEGKIQALGCPKVEDVDAYCPACTARKALYAAGDKKNAGEIRASERYLANAFVEDNKGGRWKPVVLQYPYVVHKAITAHIDAEIDAEGFVLPERIPIVNAANPSVIQVQRTGQALQTKYTVTVPRKIKNTTSEMLGKRKDLSEFVDIADEDILESMVCNQLGIGSLDELGPDADTNRQTQHQSKATDDAPSSSATDIPTDNEEVANDNDYPCVGMFEDALADERQCPMCELYEACKAAGDA